MTYYRAGQGETVLLVHGITTYSFIWQRVFQDLSQQFDVIAVDLLGCGDSDKPLDISYAVKDHAEILHEFMTCLAISKFHFVGHDLGGGMGQIFAVKYPEMLYDLVLANSVAYDFWPVQPIIALRTPVIRMFMMAAVDLGAFKLIVKHGIYHKDLVTPELMEKYLKPLQTSVGRKAFLRFAKDLNNHNLMAIAPQLRKLAMPVLIIRGDADPYLSSAIAEKLHDEIPNSKLKKIATASHYIQEDEPQWLIDTIIRFYQKR
jgi:pimeloyl-ACP methyl ester carboxylesterase